MADDFTAKFKVDVSDLKKGISDATKSIREANATFKAETAGMERWSKDADGLSAKLKQLGNNLKSQKSILSSYQEQLKKQQEAYTENGNRAQQLKAKLQELANNGVAKTDAEYQKYEKSLKTVVKEQQNNATAIDDLKLKILEEKAAIGQTEASIKRYESASKSLATTVSTQQNKLSKLKAEYADVVAAEGKNSASAKKLASEIKNLSTDLDKNQAELKQSTDAANKLDKTFQDTEKSADGLAGKLAGGLKKGLAVAAAGMAAMGAAAVSIGKSAIENYAQYEQLIGGVETLFGTGGKSIEEYAKSVGKSVKDAEKEYKKLEQAQTEVVKNANDAYKNAGMSANQYMETVTSFSASLISSVGGDTVKAADYANRAIVDMSDNANKMGTNIGSIQNAYQGFAKQNYTMLDNLKLGYGGTKTEMQRLIKDAAKMTDVQEKLGITVDESSMSFGNIVNAISVMQENMGIAGTTAKEAGETIEGSANAMKAAWSNLMTGIADDTQDFDALMNNFTDSLLTLLQNVMPRIQTVIGGLGKLMAGLMEDVLPKLVETIPPILQDMLPLLVQSFRSLISGVAEAMPELLKVFLDIVPQITQSITELLPELVSVGIQMITAIIQGAGEIIPQVVTQVVQMVPQLVQALVDGIPALIDGAIQFFMAIIEAIPVIIQELATALPQIVDTIINGLTSAIPQLIEGAITLLHAIVDAIPQIIPPLIDALPKIVTSIVDGLISQIPVLLDGAIQLLTAIIQAIPVIITDLVSEIPKIIVAIVETLVSNIPKLIEGAIQLFTGILQAIPTIVVELVKEMPKIIAAIVGGLIGGIGEVFSAAGELFFGIVDQSKAAQEELIKQNEAIYAYRDALEETAPQIADYNNLLSSQGNTISDVDSKIREAENGITEVFRTALKEQRDLREEDIVSIEQYLNDLNEAQAEKMEIYRTQQIAQLKKLQLESGTITQETAAQHLANTQAALDEANKATEDAYTTRLGIIEQGLAAGEYKTDEDYKNALAKAKEEHDKQLQENQSYYNEALQILSEKSAEWVQTDSEKWAALNQGMDQFNVNSENGFNNFMLKAGDWAGSFNGTKEQYLAALKSMDRESANGFLNMLASVKENGGQIPEESKQIAADMLGAFDDLPDSLDEAGKDALLGMIYGMEDQIPGLQNTSEMSANEIVDTIKDYLGIASPSKVLEEIGENTVAGFVQGMENQQGSLDKVSTTLSSSVAKIFTSNGNKMKEIGANIAKQIGSGFNSSMNKVSNLAKNLAQNIIKIFDSNKSKFQKIGTEIVNAILSKMNDGKSKLDSAAKKLANSMLSIFKDSVSSFKTAGANMANGVAQGFLNQEYSVKSKVNAMMNRIVSSAKSKMKIASPSKVWAEIGDFMAQGLGVGFVDEMKVVNKKIQNSMPTKLANGLLNQMSGTGRNGAIAGNTTNSKVTNYTQIINAPKQPSRIELYRQTKNLLSLAEGGLV